MEKSHKECSNKKSHPDTVISYVVIVHSALCVIHIIDVDVRLNHTLLSYVKHEIYLKYILHDHENGDFVQDISS